MAVKGVVAPQDYAFNAAAKTVTFSSTYAGLVLSDVMYITNIASGTATVIYDPFDSTKGGTLSSLVLTLAFNTTAMNNSDSIQIILGRVTTSDAVNFKDTAIVDGKSAIEILTQILFELRINNALMAELPIVLQGKGGVLHDPIDFRKEPSLFAE